MLYIYMLYYIYIHTPLHIPLYMHLNTICCCLNLLKKWWFNHQQRGDASPGGAPLWYPWGPQGPRLLPRKEEVGLGHVFHDPNGLRTPGRKGRNRWKGEMTNRFHHRNSWWLWDLLEIHGAEKWWFKMGISWWFYGDFPWWFTGSWCDMGISWDIHPSTTSSAPFEKRGMGPPNENCTSIGETRSGFPLFSEKTTWQNWPRHWKVTWDVFGISTDRFEDL